MARKFDDDTLKSTNTESLITLTLTESQYGKLLDALYQYDDGPTDEDKPSRELEELRVIVEAASLQETSLQESSRA